MIGEGGRLVKYARHSVRAKTEDEGKGLNHLSMFCLGFYVGSLQVILLGPGFVLVKNKIQTQVWLLLKS
jgi:hypothetical protein